MQNKKNLKKRKKQEIKPKKAIFIKIGIRSRTAYNLRKIPSETNLLNMQRGKINSKMNSMFFKKNR